MTTILAEGQSPAMTDIVALPENLDDLPEPAPFYYVIGKKGPLVHKKTMFGKVLVPVTEISHLGEGERVLWKDIPKVPAALISQVWSFFAQVWATRKTEAMVYLTWKDGQYRVFVPNQHPTGGHVSVKDFDRRMMQRGWRIAGTIHSHCNFGAFHSGTDTADADKHDGIHMTMGHVDDPKKFEIAVMVSMNKVHWDVKLDEAIDGEIQEGSHPSWWHRHIGDELPRTEPPKSWSGNGHLGSGFRPHPRQTMLMDDKDWEDYMSAKYGPVKSSRPRLLTGGTPKDPYLASTPLNDVRMDDPIGVIDVLIARGYAIPEWGDNSGPLDLDDWSQQVMETAIAVEQLDNELRDLGVEMHVEYGIDTTNLIRPNHPANPTKPTSEKGTPA